MSLKPAGFDRAIEALRAEGSTAEAQESARRSILSAPSARSKRYRGLVICAASAVAAVILWPNRHSGFAWGQAVAKTLEAPNAIFTCRLPTARISTMRWRSGNRRATVLYDAQGHLALEMRSNGTRVVRYFEMPHPPGLTDQGPNSERYATVSTETTGSSRRNDLVQESIDGLLSDPLVTVVSREGPTESRPYQRYRVKRAKPYNVEWIVDVDPASGRVHQFSDPTGLMTETVDYPPAIPDSIFEPRLQLATGVHTYDADALSREAHSRILHGYGARGPVNLRLVGLDSTGSVWAFWTGALPDSRLSHPVRLPSIRCERAYGPKNLTSSATAGTEIRVPGLPVPLGGMAVVPKVKIGTLVDIDIPYRGGLAHYRRIPVMRFGDMHNITDLRQRRQGLH